MPLRPTLLFALLLPLCACKGPDGANGGNNPGVTASGQWTEAPADGDGFQQALDDKFCEEWATCDPSFDCETAAGNWLDSELCIYDQDAALACLNGEWTCDMATVMPFVVQPAACYDVLECPSSA